MKAILVDDDKSLRWRHVPDPCPLFKTLQLEFGVFAS